MPVYDYKCPQHGVFHDLASMDMAAKPAACPQCRQLSPRIIMIPPEVLAMAPNKRKAMARNEEAKHQPIISTADVRAEKAARDQHAHKKGCGCSQHKPAGQSALRQQVIYTADGSKTFPSQRPWMISH